MPVHQGDKGWWQGLHHQGEAWLVHLFLPDSQCVLAQVFFTSGTAVVSVPQS